MKAVLLGIRGFKPELLKASQRLGDAYRPAAACVPHSKVKTLQRRAATPLMRAGGLQQLRAELEATLARISFTPCCVARRAMLGRPVPSRPHQKTGGQGEISRP
jgi:hypothetical protein